MRGNFSENAILMGDISAIIAPFAKYKTRHECQVLYFGGRYRISAKASSAQTKKKMLRAFFFLSRFTEPHACGAYGSNA
ncbi:MAG: hypothetical protein WAQ25_00760 [Candidatus Saccharimonas sp.]